MNCNIFKAFNVFFSSFLKGVRPEIISNLSVSLYSFIHSFIHFPILLMYHMSAVNSVGSDTDKVLVLVGLTADRFLSSQSALLVVCPGPFACLNNEISESWAKVQSCLYPQCLPRVQHIVGAKKRFVDCLD